jgi:hypothetical protein
MTGNRNRNCIGAASIFLILPMMESALTNANAQVRCDKILPVVQIIEVFASSTDAVPREKIEAKRLNSPTCKLAEENSRYKISLNSEDVWVPTAQFRGDSFAAPKPLLPKSRSTPAGPAGTSAGARPSEPVATAVGNRKGSSSIGVVPTAAPALDTTVTISDSVR